MKKSNKKTKEPKLNIFLLIISFILIILSFILEKYGVIRPILWLISIIILTFDIVKNYKLKLNNAIILFIIFFILSLFLDGILVISLKRIPVFAYNITTTDKARVYNAIGLRAWQCDKDNYKDIKVDVFNNKGYMCNIEDIDVIDSNSFLNSIVENYNDYKNLYVKINGKISKKTGRNYIEMNPYENKDITLNGYVSFADNISLRIIFNEDEPSLDNYDVYDEITVVGVIKNLETEGNKYVIYMYESKVISEVNLEEYHITATHTSECTDEKNIIYTNENNKIYTKCIEDIIVSYPNETKYELAYVLSSNKIKIANLYENAISEIKSETDESIIYNFDTYSILVCDTNTSKDIIIGDKNISFENTICDPKIEENLES